MNGSEPEFDKFSGDYDAALNQGLSLTGDSKEYYAQGRVTWLVKRLNELQFKPTALLDFGCGTGGATRWFSETFDLTTLIGVDPSEDSLAVARKHNADVSVAVFTTPAGFSHRNAIDLAFCNGVFHHIPIDERQAAMEFIFDSLRPGGMFAMWDNNPWNLGTRFVMSRISFDREAILVWPHRARQMFRNAGFDVLLTDYVFVFPRPLAFLRPLESQLCKFPTGGQYLVLGMKPN